MERKTKMTASLVVGFALLFTGCGTGERQAVRIQQEPYVKTTYQTTEVLRGDLNPSMTLTLQTQGYEEIVYGATNPDLTLDTVYVSVGERVQKGDLLVSFESERIQQQIAEYEDQKKQNELLVEHYENLMKVDANADYKADISMIRSDIAVEEIYIEEAKSRLSDYQLVAKETGTITSIDKYLQSGYFFPSANLIKQVCGSGKYSSITTNPELFTVGETYTATAGVAEYELRLAEINEQELTFEPISDMSAVSEADELTMVIEKPQIKNAVYVPKDAVKSVTDKDGEKTTFYVYLLKENGFREAIPVTVGDRVEDWVVITQGLNGGEKVTLK